MIVRIQGAAMSSLNKYFARTSALPMGRSKLNALSGEQLQDAFSRLQSIAQFDNGGLVSRAHLANAPAASVEGYDLGEVFGSFARFAQTMDRVANPPAVTEAMLDALRSGALKPARAKTLQRDALTDLYRLSSPYQERAFQDAARAELGRIHGDAAAALTEKSIKPLLEMADEHGRRAGALEALLRLHTQGLAPIQRDLLLSSVSQLSRYGRVKDVPVLDVVRAAAQKSGDAEVATAAGAAVDRLKTLQNLNVAFLQLEGGQTAGSGIKSYVNPTTEALAAQGHRVDVYLPVTAEFDPVAKGLTRVAGGDGEIKDVIGASVNFKLWREGDTADRPNGGRKSVFYFQDDMYFGPRRGQYDDADGVRFSDDPARLLAGSAFANAAMSKVAAIRKLEAEGAEVTNETVRATEQRLMPSDAPSVIQYNDSHLGFGHAMLQFNGAFREARPLGVIHQGNPAYRRWMPREMVERMMREIGGGVVKALEALPPNEWVDPLEMMANTMQMSTVSNGYYDYLLNTFHASPRVMSALQEAAAEGRVASVQNGIDLTKLNPANIAGTKQAAAFNARDLSGRIKCKEDVQRAYGFTVDPDAPLLAFVHRMTREKGLQNLLFEMRKTPEGQPETPLDVVLAENPKLQILLGGPDPAPELLAQAKALAARWPGRVVVKGERLDNRQIMSGTDVFLMPSVEEPCGIAQMEAQALGSAIMYLNHHGPKGTVLPYDPITGRGTGFPIEPGSISALLDGLRTSVAWASRSAKGKEALQRNAMEYAKTFDVTRMAENHSALLREAVTLTGLGG